MHAQITGCTQCEKSDLPVFPLNHHFSFLALHFYIGPKNSPWFLWLHASYFSVPSYTFIFSFHCVSQVFAGFVIANLSDWLSKQLGL